MAVRAFAAWFAHPNRWHLRLPVSCTALRSTCLAHTPLPACPAEEAESVHRVAWSLHSGGGAAWLASAGAAGLMRCQWIASQ